MVQSILCEIIHVHTLLNVAVATAKLAVWSTRKNRLLSVGYVDVLFIFYVLLKSCLQVEFAYFKMIGDIQTCVWTPEGVFCNLGEAKTLSFIYDCLVAVYWVLA